MARIRIAYSIKRQSGRSVADREKRRERRDEAPVHPKGLGRRAARASEGGRNLKVILTSERVASAERAPTDRYGPLIAN